MNQYLEVHRRAAERTANKWAEVRARDHWYENPLRFVDADVMFSDDGRLRKRQSILALAWQTLQDERFGTSDVVEASALMNLFRDALSTFEKRGTKSQLEALLLAHEADLSGETATNYIARERGINRHSAYKLLKRAEKALLETSQGNSSILKIEIRIKEQARAMPRYCAACGNDCEDGLHSLCASCHMRFEYREDFLNGTHRREIQDSMRISSMNHWREARRLVQMQT